MSDRDVRDIHVDRETEKRLFRQMLKGEADAHILLIQADSGLGKSSLLREFRDMSQAFPTFFIDLKPRHTSEGILFDCCFQLGPNHFSRFHDICQQIVGAPRQTGALQSQQRSQLRRILSEQFDMDDLVTLCFDLTIPFGEIPGDTLSRKAVELILYLEREKRLPELLDWISRVRPTALSELTPTTAESSLTQLLNTQVKNKLAGMDYDQRLIYRRMLTAAFFDDLHAVHKQQEQSFVFMFDTFNEEIITEVKEWIDDFLKGARIHPWLIVVVAGQKFPNLSFDDRNVCYRHVLLPFEPDDVQEFARQVDLPLEPNDLELIYGGTQGKPLLLATILDNLRKRRANQ